MLIAAIEELGLLLAKWDRILTLLLLWPGLNFSFAFSLGMVLIPLFEIYIPSHHWHNERHII